jgi:putative N6-adenine-specific DNA methylase
MVTPVETIFVSTTPGLEPALLHEAQGLGEARAVEGGVQVRGDAGLHRRANLELRLASRVMLEVARVEAAASRPLDGFDWSPFLLPGEQVALEILSPQRLALPRWPVSANGGLAARLRIEGKQLVLSVDTSGELLHRRGYRQETSHAPLRETLAAGLLALARYDPREPLWDPMCGSGTLPIEAAWIAQDRAPGLARTFAFERFPAQDAAAWAREQAAATARIHVPPAPILASDKNAGALGVARRNARRAQAGEALTLSRLDATVPQRDFQGPGLVLANLPYGKRVGRDLELETLYRAFADALRAGVPGWRVGWLVADAALLDVGIAWQSQHRLENGGLPCVFALGTL